MEANKKWYNVELPYNTKEAIKRVDNFKFWLDENGFKCEPSGCYNMVHLEVLATETDLPKINKALDDIVWFDAITEK